MPRLLDIGCGIGAFMEHMRRHSWLVEGTEPSAMARETASKKFSLLIHPTEKLFDAELGTFDIITMWHVMEHVHSLHTYIERLGELLRPKATLFIAVPNYTSYDA